LAHSAIFGICAISDHRTTEKSAQKDAKITKIQSSQVNARRIGAFGFFILRFPNAKRRPVNGKP
jgi:hypothetical protein